MIPSPDQMKGTAASFSSIEQGELIVGVATKQLKAVSTPCIAVWFGAPTAQHTSGVNTTPMLIGGASGGNASGGMTLAADDYKGFIVLCNDASKLYITGFTAADSVEYQIYT